MVCTPLQVLRPISYKREENLGRPATVINVSEYIILVVPFIYNLNGAIYLRVLLLSQAEVVLNSDLQMDLQAA